MSSSAAEAAAALGAEMSAQLVEAVPGPAEEGTDVLAQQIAARAVEATAPVVEQPSEAVAPDAQETAEAPPEVTLPDYEPELPEDLLEELDEPDFALEAATEVAEQLEEEYLDDVAQEERRKRIELEKKLAWTEGRLVQSNRAKWEAEAKKYFPLCEHALGEIKADSRRAFLRAAKSQHEKVLPYVKPLIDALKEERASAVEGGRAEGRKIAEDAWGRPTVGPARVPVEASAAVSEVEAARKTGQLHKVLGVMLRQAGVNQQ